MRHNQAMNLRTALLLCCLALLPAVALAQADSAIDTEVAVDQTAEPTPDGAVPLADIQRFVSVYRAVRQGYVDELSAKKVMQPALRGLITDLDPHRAYLYKGQAHGRDEFPTGSSDGLDVGLLQLPDTT